MRLAGFVFSKVHKLKFYYEIILAYACVWECLFTDVGKYSKLLAIGFYSCLASF